MSALEQYQITGGTAREIATSIESAIVEGRLRPGEALPTVRALAQTLGTSPATTSSAYGMLRTRGLVVAQGRLGTRVAPRPALRPSAPPRPVVVPPGVRDLSIGWADPELLPPIGPALAQVADRPPAAIERLGERNEELVGYARRWFAADGLAVDAVTVTSGALDAVERVLAAHLRIGDRVMIEDPAYPPIRDVLLAQGLVPVPLALDDRGILPAALERALATGAEALVAVPRGQNPTGGALDETRAGELRGLLAPHRRLLIFEDDHLSTVAGVPFQSSISPESERWAVVRSMSKILHPDLRIGLLAGDETTVARVEGRQALGPRWVSHILQSTAARLLTDRGFEALCRRAGAAYAARRRGLIEALAARGIRATGASGLNVWVSVPEETTAVRALADAGWLVLAGERFRVASPPGLRITISTLRDCDFDPLADAIAAAVARTGRPRY